MLRLRKILLCDYLYYLILFISIIIVLVLLSIPGKSKYTGKEKYIVGAIDNITNDNDKLVLIIKVSYKEKVKSTYYYKSKEECKNIINSITLGDKLKIYGKLNVPDSSSTKDLFDYKKYLNRRGIYYIQKVNKIILYEENKNIFYTIKEKIIKRCSNPYLKVFILGDKSKIDTDILSNYRDLGISHLFAISGMHISLLASMLLSILKKIRVNEEKRYLIVSIILILYLLLTGFSPSILRAVLFFIMFSINKVYYFYIKNTNIYILVLVFSLLFNPNYIYDIGFLYSFSISLALIVMGDFINSYNSYLKKVFITSFISFIVSIPITLYSFNCFNVLGIIYNIFYVPFISIIVFPLSIITFIFPFFNNVYNLLTSFLEQSSRILMNISFSKFVFCSNNIYFYFIYVLFIIIFLYGLRIRKKYSYLLLLSLLVFHYFEPLILNNDFIYALDVGQGDSMIIHIDNKTILLDTGGIESLKDKKYVVKNITLPILKKYGIKTIDYLVLTHGDYDHMGEAINLVENFKVEKVIFNCGEYNDLEQELITVLDKKKIPYYSCVKELNVDNNKLYFLQTKEYDNENDNSNVIYTEINGYKFMFMGDAGIEKEKDILEQYNISNIDVLKVGHHGSNTSSSKNFINEMNPKYSIISVGKNNRYGHPNKEVLNNLKDSKIYRTDQDGSIMFKIKNNKIQIETCTP